MNSVRTLGALLVSMGSVLFVVAILSRILTIPHIDQIIKDGASALVKLFNGAFGA